MLNAHFDHLRLSFEHRNHLHHFGYKVIVTVSLIRFHNSDDLAVDNCAALSLNFIVQLGCRISLLIRSLFDIAYRNQVHTEGLTREFHVESNHFGVAVERWFLYLF